MEWNGGEIHPTGRGEVMRFEGRRREARSVRAVCDEVIGSTSVPRLHQE